MLFVDYREMGMIVKEFGMIEVLREPGLPLQHGNIKADSNSSFGFVG